MCVESSSFDDAILAYDAALENVAGDEPALEARKPVLETHTAPRLGQVALMKERGDLAFKNEIASSLRSSQ